MQQFLKDEYGEKMLALPTKRTLLFQVAEMLESDLDLRTMVVNTLDLCGEHRLGLHVSSADNCGLGDGVLRRAREIWRKFL